MFGRLKEDIQTIFAKDPAARNLAHMQGENLSKVIDGKIIANEEGECGRHTRD